MADSWYALQSKSNKEDALYKQLLKQGFEVFYPQIRVNPENPRARKIKPYFPGYMFVRVDLAAVGLSTLQWMPFSRGIILFDQDPAVVPDSLIVALRRRVEQVNAAGGELFASIDKGDEVFIHEGPFAGYEAIFDLRISGSERVRVLIKLLDQRHIPVELHVGQIRQVKPVNKP